MFSNLQTSQGQNISLAEQALGLGGEGQVFAVLLPKELQNYVVKIYHPKERTTDKHLKIKYLKENPPQLKNDFSVIWIEELVYEKTEFVGFLMRKAISGIDLTYLCSLQISEKLPVEWHQKYTRTSIDGLSNRTKICYNLAAALSQIHQTEKYVLLDLKPENIKIQVNGQVSLLDLDSVEVIENQKVIFPAQKLTLEYSPAERKQLSLQNDYIPETWDRFSLAVVFYKVLFGLHPFAATGKGELAKLVSHEQKIEAGLFAHGSKRADLEVIPKPHANFEALSYDLKELFVRAFDEGFYQPKKRPSAAEWCKALQNAQLIQANYQSPIQNPNKPKSPIKENKPLNPSKSNTYYTSSPFIILVIVVLFLAVVASFSGRMDWLDWSGKKLRPLEDIKILSDEDLLSDDQKEIKKLITLDYTEVISPNNRKYRIEKNSLFYLEKGQTQDTQIKYDSISESWNEMYIFKKDNKYGMLCGGYEVIPNIYEDLGGINEGLIYAKKDGYYGYITATNRIIIPFKYKKAWNFKNNRAWVELGGKQFYINLSGQFSGYK